MQDTPQRPGEDFLAELNSWNPSEETLSSTSSTKWERWRPSIAETLRVSSDSIAVKWVANAGRFGNAFGEAEKSVAASPSPCVCVILVRDENLVAGMVSAVGDRVGARHAFAAVLVLARTPLGWRTAAVVEPRGGRFTPVVKEVSPDVEVVEVRADPAPDQARHAGPPVIVDDRIREMLRVAIASSSAVVLVGPPGTGKTSLLMEAIAEAAESPGEFGLTTAPVSPLIVTPEESWTTRELVGGETVDDSGRLRFRPGHVLDAIQRNQWLVLDEANRADMDRIFGALLTWLSGHEPLIGRASSAASSALVSLGWSEGPICNTEGAERLEADDVGEEPIRFRAGTDWRLLGTYNAADAQRVFRFGQALGRRLTRVPIPPPLPEDFEAIVQDRGEDLPQQLRQRLVSLYRAHFEVEATRIGPALVLTAMDYLRRGIELGATGEQQVRRLAEGYLTSTGWWIAKLEEFEQEELGKRITGLDALPAPEWQWIAQNLPYLMA